MNRAYLFAGLPGSGKSTAAEIGKTLTNGSVLEAGEMIREMARDDGIENPSSKELGEYAATSREEHGTAFFAERSVGMILRGEYEVEYPLFVDSVRHIDSVTEFSEFFDSTFLIFVDAPLSVRYERLTGRGRDDEADFTVPDLMDRDRRELTELGTETIIDNDRVDYKIQNVGDQEYLRDELSGIVV